MNKTDWDIYYAKSKGISSLTRAYTTSKLLSLIARWAGSRPGLHIAELGGAGSCFINPIMTQCAPAQYHIYDNNAYGLDLLRSQVTEPNKVSLHNLDILNLKPDKEFDVVFSVGLIEHFEPMQTLEIVKKHFELARQGGLIVISYPYPTFLYKISRSLAELFNLWIFHDERPLKKEEIAATILRHGDIVSEEILWPIIFTQQALGIIKK
jgi:2-polyprenyl-3-methyl-5-hydroxy-6-metoxy-1,4-benzoquinol methylase